MEDGLYISDDLYQEIGEAGVLLGVFDGHGGDTCMNFLVKSFKSEFIKLYKTGKDNIPQLLTNLFQSLDDQIKSDPTLNSQEAGSTGTIGFMRKEKLENNENTVLYIGNVGDTRAVLFEENVAIRLTYDDKATDEVEQERVIKDGGNLFQGRVNGQLAITRAFGDHSLSSSGVICRPHLTKIVIRPSHKYLVVASDGLWDMIDDRSAIEFIYNQKTLKEKAIDLIKNAQQAGSKDNIIVLVIQISQ